MKLRCSINETGQKINILRCQETRHNMPPWSSNPKFTMYVWVCGVCEYDLGFLGQSSLPTSKTTMVALDTLSLRERVSMRLFFCWPTKNDWLVNTSMWGARPLAQIAHPLPFHVRTTEGYTWRCAHGRLVEKPTPSTPTLISPLSIRMDCGNGRVANSSKYRVHTRTPAFASYRSLRGVSTGRSWSERTQKPGSSNSSA